MRETRLMNEEDIRYLCTTIGNLAGIPIRLYKKDERSFYYSLVHLIRDPITPFEEKILRIQAHIGYFITPGFHYYGIVNADEYKIVLGPSRQYREDKSDLVKLAFECDVPIDETENFIMAMDSLVQMPMNSILQTMCSINFVLNGEKLSLADIMIYDEEQVKLSKEIESLETEKNYNQTESFLEKETPVHNTLTLEQTLLNFVQHGDTAALKEWMAQAPAARPGILSLEALRQQKNTFIVTATLVSRAAIRGGVDANDALSLSDAYIQKSEMLSSIEEIDNLQYHMVFDFTGRVEKIRIGKTPTKLMTDIANYVQKHLTEPMDIQSLAKAMFVSRTYLAVKFKKETGMTLTQFILKEKTEEGKRLLRYTEKPVSAIAAYLGFSSQSHFTNVFKKLNGCSPNEYRMMHNH